MKLEESDMTRVLNWLDKYNISARVDLCPAESDRVRVFGPHVRLIQVDDFEWEFLPTGCLERFTTGADSRWSEETV